PDEEIDLVCKLLFYQPTGYHSNPQKLWKDLKAEGYQFLYKKIYTPRVSYSKISRPNCVHQYDLLFLTYDYYKNKKWIAVLNIIDVASRFKASVPLTSKKSSEVAKAFEKIYDNSNNPLTYLTLLQYDNGKE
ncbi:26139_t:CDS:2, partial [Racocetra persica]